MVSLEAKLSEQFEKNRNKAECAVNCKLVQCKMQEENSAVSYGETDEDKNKLPSRS
jgi:hypothetical protein